MTIMASFEPSRITSSPGEPAGLMLRLKNETSASEVVTLRAQGELAAQTVLQSDTIHLDAGEVFELPVVIDVNSGLPAGPHSSGVVVSSRSGTSSSAEATIDVLEAPAYEATLVPPRSSSDKAGRHRVSLVNRGNAPILIELEASPIDDDAEIELGTTAVSLDSGGEATVDLRIVPPLRFWSGTTIDHEFVVHTRGSDSRTTELYGTFHQLPRVRSWLLPAAVGMLGALLLGTLAWFWLLKPWVEQTAQNEAADAVAADRAVLQQMITRLEDAAARAAELPLGTPADLRLEASAAPGDSATDSFAVSSSRLLSVTDIVFQNPTGAVGTVSLLRNGDVLLESDLANFRDLDFHFVAPFEYEGGSTVAIELVCETPGPGESECTVGTSLTGFVADAP
jgi:hypothetical protein